MSELLKTKAKLKKRELCGGTKGKTTKPNAKRQKDSAQQLTRQQLVDQENRQTAIGLGRSKNNLFGNGNGRLGSLHRSKAKVSETVTSRRVLGDLQTNGIPANQLHYDLQRVLGKDASASHIPQPLPTSKPSTRELERKDSLLDVNTTGTGVDCSPKTKVPPPQPHPPSTPSLPLVEIGQRLVEGLQVDVIFPHSCYLDNIKAELKKILKQSNPYGYEELVGYFSTSEPALATPFITQLQHTMLPGVEISNLLTSEAGLHAALGTGVGVGMVPINPFPTATTNTSIDLATAITEISVNNGAPSGTGVSDVVALNLEVNTSALNINDQCSPGHTPRPRDFLDLMDSVATTHHVMPPDWNATPTRPRMFPHKLY